MKQRKPYVTAKQRLFKILLFSFIAFIGFSHQTNAQWSFTFRLQASGNCPGASPAISTANSMLSSIPNMGLPTQSMCEGLRQQVLAISVSAGGCTISYVCTECTGSDLASQINPGDVSFHAASQGLPFFSVHQSAAFQDWARDYRQQLASYGITSILGNTLTGPKVLLTGNKDFDAAYNKLAAGFINPAPPAPPANPPAPPNNPPNQDASVVDLSGKSLISDKPVSLLRKPDEDKALKVTPPPVPVPVAGEIKEGHEYIDFGRESLVDLIGLAPKQYSYLGIAIVDIGAEDAKAIKDVWDGKACPSTSTILTNALKQTVTDEASQGLGDVGGMVSGELFKSLATKKMIKKGVLPGIEGVVQDGRIASIGEAHYGIITGAVNTGNKILKATGVNTFFNDDDKK